MKKNALCFALVLAMGLFTGCGQSGTDNPPTDTSAPAEENAESTNETEEPTEEASSEESEDTGTAPLKTGMAIVSSVSGVDAGEDDGVAQIDSLAVAVVVDGDGRIADCTIDMAWNTLSFTADGKVVRRDDLQSKRELGDDYGMREASGIGREWYEQADALEEYVIGKTAEEISGITVDEETRAVDVDLAASVTIRLADYKDAIVEAAKNAEEIGTQEGDKLGLGIFTHADFSADASEEMNGQCEADSCVAAVTVDADGKITASLIDATQNAVQFDTAGKITSDVTAETQTKRQLGNNYGMRSVSGIEKEWYEQADFIEEYIIGRTAEEIGGIALDDDSRALEVPDLTSGATIRFNVFQNAIVKAVQNAE